MRYKVKVEAEEDFPEVKKAAESYTKVFVESARRRMLSIGELSEAAKRHLRKLGAKVTPEIRYDADKDAA